MFFFDDVSAGYFNLGLGVEYVLGEKKKTVLFAKAYLGIQGRIMAISTFITLSVLVLDLERRKTVMKMEFKMLKMPVPMKQV